MRFIIATLATCLLLPALSLADAEIQLRDGSKFKSIITEESTLGIKVQSKKELIPAADIVDVAHEVKPLNTQINMNRPAQTAEKDAADPAKEASRPKNLKAALDKYRETLKNMDPGQTFAERQLQFKMAYLTTLQAREGAATPELAVIELRTFKEKHPNSWQLTNCLKTMAELQILLSKFADAEASYKELANAAVDPQTKQEAEFLSAQVSIRAGNHVEAQKRLQALLGKLPKESPVVGRTKIAIAESLLATKQADDARKLLKEIIDGTQDGDLKARAYNTIGKSYFDAAQYKEARWEFLWVELMYNQNRDGLRALYHLWQIFSMLGEQERALECRDLLLNNTIFLGSEYQRLAKQKAG